MESFRGVDYYGIEDLLSEEERMNARLKNICRGC